MLVAFFLLRRWQLLALLAALQAEEGLPLPVDLSRISITLRSKQGPRENIKARAAVGHQQTCSRPSYSPASDPVLNISLHSAGPLAALYTRV